MKKGKTPLFKCATAPTEAPEASTTDCMVILTEYELIENLEKCVFCKERGTDPLPLL